MPAELPPDLARQLAAILRRLDRLELGARLPSASVGSGGIRVADDGAIRSTDFDGEGLDDPGDAGWWLGPEGLVVNRAVIRTGSLIVTDQATQRGNAGYDPATTQAASPRTIVSGTVDVPDWATRAVVLSSLSCTVQSDAADQFIQIFSAIEGTDLDGLGFIVGDTAMHPFVAQDTRDFVPGDATLNYSFKASVSGPATAVDIEAPTISVFVVFSDE